MDVVVAYNNGQKNKLDCGLNHAAMTAWYRVRFGAIILRSNIPKNEYLLIIKLFTPPLPAYALPTQPPQNTDAVHQQHSLQKFLWQPPRFPQHLLQLESRW